MSSEHLQLLLRQRDSIEREPFENLIYTISDYVSELESTLILVDSLKVSLRRARLFQADPEASKTSGSFVEYESKIKELKEERAELYKQQSQQATQMLHLNDQLRGRDSSIVTLTNQISSLKGVQEQQSEDNRRLEENIKEKDAAIQNISDELITLQLELLRLDQWQQQQQCINPDNNDKNTSSSSLNIPARRMKIVKEKEIVAPHQYPLSCFASNAISHQLLTGSEDQKIILYDLTRISTKSVLKWSQMNGPIVALAIDESGSFVASCSAYDAEVTIWSLQSGKIQNTLQFSTEEDCPMPPLLKFGIQSRLWMCSGKSVRLWDFQRGLLLRTWKGNSFTENTITEIAPDFKRPDRLWCFDELGRYSVINAVNGKFECEWKSIALEGKRVLFSVFNDQVLMAHETSDSLNQILSGYTMNSQTTELEKSFDFDLREDLLKDLEANSTFTIKQIYIHSERIGLFGVLLKMKDCSGTRVLIVQVSPDHWKPESGWLDEFEGCQGAFGDELCWGPVEEDPITREIGSKLLLLSKEDKTIQLYTVHTNTQGTPVN